MLRPICNQNRGWLCMAAVAACLGILGCVSSEEQRQTTGLGAPQSPAWRQANDSNQEGVDRAANGDLAGAEAYFKEALQQDPMYGPAHNNLGIVYFRQGNYYEAAWQFQFAMKLMPRSVSVRTNLGLLLEAAGRPQDALEHYEAALKLMPEDPVTTAYMARASVKAKRPRDGTLKLLEKVVLRSVDESWNTWARRQLLRMAGREQE